MVVCRGCFGEATERRRISDGEAVRWRLAPTMMRWWVRQRRGKWCMEEPLLSKGFTMAARRSLPTEEKEEAVALVHGGKGGGLVRSMGEEYG